MYGTTNTQIAVTLNCSESNPCQKIEMRDINIAYNGGGGPAKSACDNAYGASHDQKSARLPIGDSGVDISDVHFSNIQGTTTTQIAVALNCSVSNPCQKIEMRDIDIAYNGDRGPALSACANAHGSCYGEEHPPSCLLA
ncbi:hypothetical protein Dsin_023278 [Dipteronia sinensis]|uniref:Polygalacturonase n=1 Tax=Dipteronia sinensis TaxID=43782 RepID=A0AAE0A3C0_9ROSI|nr:hypothetical protein Dsin_023278 [Dipteronia sinensis]